MEERDLYAGGITVTGVVLVALQLFQGVQQLEAFEGVDLIIVFVFETLPFVVVALALAFVGSWLYTDAEIGTEMQRVAIWGLGSVLLFVSLAALLIFSLEVTLGNVIPQTPFVVINLMTVGAFVGVLVGIYDARSQITRQEMERERKRVESFAKKAADINNYGRELNRCGSVEEVSSLCLQAMQTFLGLTNLAFVITDEGETTFVDDTTVGVSTDNLESLARESLGQEPATVVTHDLPENNKKDVDTAFSLLITTHDDGSAVLLALTDGDTVIADEDTQLLEMLVSHAATALDRIYDVTAEQSGTAA